MLKLLILSILALYLFYFCRAKYRTFLKQEYFILCLTFFQAVSSFKNSFSTAWLQLHSVKFIYMPNGSDKRLCFYHDSKSSMSSTVDYTDSSKRGTNTIAEVSDSFPSDKSFMEIFSCWCLKKCDRATWGKFHPRSRCCLYSIVCWRTSVLKNPPEIDKYSLNPSVNNKSNLFSIRNLKINKWNVFFQKCMGKVFVQSVTFVFPITFWSFNNLALE